MVICLFVNGWSFCNTSQTNEWPLMLQEIILASRGAAVMSPRTGPVQNNNLSSPLETKKPFVGTHYLNAT
eukprot:UN34741